MADNAPGTPVEMGGSDPTITIPALRVSQADGATIKAGLPANGTLEMNELAPRACHDTGIILGKVNKAVCAGHDGFSVWSMNAEDGGSFEDPALLYSQMIDADVTIGHSGIFLPDGKVIVFGHEPGGGTQPRCTATGTVLPGGVVQTDDMKSMFFYDTETGEELGRFVLPRDQAVSESCTIHNYNMVHLRSQNGKPRYVLVAGNYQAGISVVDFSDPANAKEIAYADPPPLVPEFRRRRLVDVLVRRAHLRVRHHARAHDLAPGRPGDQGLQAAALLEPADADGIHPLGIDDDRRTRAAAARRPPFFSTPDGA